MKTRKVLSLIIVLAFIFAFGGCSAFGGGKNDTPVFTWNEYKSGFVDYEIKGERVYFNYEICFTNHSEEDIIISVAAIFKRKELKGWVKQEELSNGFWSEDENGDIAQYRIPAKTEKSVVLNFDGQYLGGEVNTNLSFPEDLILKCIWEENLNENEIVY